MKKRKLFVGLFCAAFSMGTAMAQGGFHHPGLLHSEADFESIRERVAAGDPDMVAALDALRNSRGIVAPGNMAVTGTIIRGISGQNYMNAYRGAAYAYQCALMWKITGDTSYAERAAETLNAWRTWNTALGGNTNISLIPGFTGYQFINAAELMRDYRSDAWGEEEFELFKQYMIDVWFPTAQDFLERRHDTVTREGNWYHYHSNWGLGNALFCVSLGILCNSPDIYNYGMYWIKEGPGNESLCVTLEHPDPNAGSLCGFGWGLIPWFHADERGPLGYLNQMQESGRDQGHSMAALGLLSYAFQSAYNQGDNAFCNLGNALVPGLAGSAMVAGAAEYVAAYNAGHDDLPYKTNWWMGALNATGRGQWRPIWQLFINHYENRMGIPMKYCHEMEDAIGMELGGGAYGQNSGGYDHTGFGDLMHNDGHRVTAEEVPTILFPQIASPTEETRNYAEISQVEPGTVLTLAVTLPEGEADTGNWRWEDGATGNQRQITADRSGIYRVTYTNANGVESTQMFSIAVRGEGIRGSFSATANYNGETIACNDTTDIKMAVGRRLSLSTAYSNWNYIESETWFVDDEQVATGGTYTYTLQDEQDHKLVFRLVTQSGLELYKVFNIIYNENDLTSILPDPDCADVTKWTTSVDGFQNQSAAVTGFTRPYIERFREASEGGMDCWGQERFDISQQLTGLQPGKYEMKASFVATQQSLSGEAGKNYVKDVYFYAGGSNVAISSQDGVAERYTLDFYVDEDGTVTFGAKNLSDQNQGYSANGLNRFAMDNFTLEYLGVEDLETDVEAMRREAAAIPEDSVTEEIYQKLAALSEGTGADVATAVALERALGEARLVKARHADYTAAYDAYNRFVEANDVDDAGLHSALQAFADAGSADEFYAAYGAMQSAWLAYMPHSGVPVDATLLLHNAGLSASETADGWRTDSGGGNFRIFAIDGSDAQRGDAVGENMIERWCTANFVAGERVIFQSVSAVPAGRYVFRAAAQKEVAAGVINLFANDATVEIGGVKVLTTTQVAVEVTDGMLTVGLRAGEGNGTRWVSMADAELEYHSPLMLIDEALAGADTLTYGTDVDGALQAAVAAAELAKASGTAEECVEAYHALEATCEQYRINNASAEHPVDLTGRIRNADFNAGNTTGWTLVRTDMNYPKFSDGVMELWHTTFELSQTLSGLPQGNYRVGLQARSDLGASNSGFRLYVQTTGAEQVSAYPSAVTRADGTDTSLHLGQNAEDMNADPSRDKVWVSAFVADGTLKIGAVCTRSDMWCVMNGFTLEYLGLGADDLAANWAEQVAVANSLDRDSLPQLVGQRLDEAVAVDIAAITADSLSRALSRLMEEIENARAVMPEYAAYLEMCALVGEIAENSEPTRATYLTVLKNRITEADREILEAETAVDVRGLYNELENARQTYVVNAVPTNGICFDMTFLVANPSCTSDGGWLNDATVNFRTLENAAQNSEYQGRFYENWIAPENVWKDGARPIYQVVEGLPNGMYELTAAAFRKVELSDADPNATDISLYVNEQRTELASTVLDYFTVRGAVTSHTAEFGLVSGAGNTANWVGLADVTLKCYGFETIEMDETDREFNVADGTFGTVAMAQALHAGRWNLVCLPFDLSSSQVRDVFDDVKELTGVSMDGTTCNLYFEDVRSMDAGVPYLVEVSEDASQWTYEEVAVDAAAIADGVVEVTDGTVTARLIGTSHVTMAEGEDTYQYAVNNSFMSVGAGVPVNGFCAYLELEGAKPERVDVYVDDALATGIHGVDADNETSKVDVYTVDGKLLRSRVEKQRALQGLPSGVYVVNGKTVVKK